MKRRPSSGGRAPCPLCTRPLQKHQLLCAACVKRLSDDLGDVVALVDDLDTMLTRQARTGGGGNVGVTSRSRETPLFWDDRASKARARLTVGLRPLAQLLQAHHGEPAPAELRRLSGWLLSSVPCLAHLPGFPAAADRAMAAAASVRHVIDRRPDMLFVGPCYAADTTPRCATHLYVEVGRLTVTCPTCATEHEVEGRQDWLLEELQDQLLHAAWISRALTTYGRPVTPGQLSGWVSRRRLLAKGLDREGRPTYRVGDVIDLLAEDAVRAEELEQKKRDEAEKAERRREKKTA